MGPCNTRVATLAPAASRTTGGVAHRLSAAYRRAATEPPAVPLASMRTPHPCNWRSHHIGTCHLLTFLHRSASWNTPNTASRCRKTSDPWPPLHSPRPTAPPHVIFPYPPAGFPRLPSGWPSNLRVAFTYLKPAWTRAQGVIRCSVRPPTPSSKPSPHS